MTGSPPNSRTMRCQPARLCVPQTCVQPRERAHGSISARKSAAHSARRDPPTSQSRQPFSPISVICVVTAALLGVEDAPELRVTSQQRLDDLFLGAAVCARGGSLEQRPGVAPHLPSLLRSYGGQVLEADTVQGGLSCVARSAKRDHVAIT